MAGPYRQKGAKDTSIITLLNSVFAFRHQMGANSVPTTYSDMA